MEESVPLSKALLGKKVRWTSPNTGRTYECWVVRRTPELPPYLAVAKDYTEFDFRLVVGHPIATQFPPEEVMVKLMPSTRQPVWVKDQL